ncbi:5,10-methylenetetrahydromethanopterin reductase [Tamaricihabitans halophyticus]|uniref:5,10-methylenetetrahydromethanopterin reductase n=1 Tax=Tamaricihabitans halophyticus TaxID=1262583 RepID=A0A4R2QJ33_9PSEU|nr:LLM class flavin-dependent oxidoreductase [Tamaricihabitans halophyticus]TCP49372.1 5,10-methylenetetrahydromethanopterin reductase [Tamaricihabitans halophyticus]
MTFNISCAFASAPSTPAHVELAEQLGYHRAWLYDSPAITADVWATAALSAVRTERINLATGMLVPRIRHPLVTASAIAQLVDLIPGRFGVGIGSGFTGSCLLGKKPMRWADVDSYVGAVQALLRGEDVAWDDSVIRMCHPNYVLSDRPIAVPWVVAAEGPKGLAVARKYGDGIASALAAPPEGFDWVTKLTFGTVLDEGESPISDRAYEAAGFGASMVYHLYYEWQGPDALDQIPGGAQWREHVMRADERVRHLVAHEGHAMYVNDIERAVMPRENVPEFTLTGTAEELRPKLAEMRAAGVTEVMYQPAGPDIPRELRAFADMAMPLAAAA